MDMDIRTIFGVLGNVTAFIAFLTPARMLCKLRRGRISRSLLELEQFGEVPYQFHTAIVSCGLWVMYGDIRDDYFLVYVNVVGFVIEVVFLTLFVLITRKCNCIDMLKNFVVVLTSLGCMDTFGRIAITLENPAIYAGAFCATASILLCVIKTETSSFLESAASFVNGVIWTIYGLIVSDIIIWVPGLVWAVVGLLLVVRTAIETPEFQIEIEMSTSMPEP